MLEPVNTYSAKWFELFMLSINPEKTAREVEFIMDQLPLDHFLSLLDICCGVGRHSNRLASLGYEIVGFDSDASILERAGEDAPLTNSPQYIHMSLDDLEDFREKFDAALLLWQSFGSGSDEKNIRQLMSINRVLKPKGRLIIDLYHRGFFEAHQGSTQGERLGLRYTEHKHVSPDGRLRVNLDYGDTSMSDKFEWRLYYPSEFIEMAKNAGFECLGHFREFDSNLQSSIKTPRVQYVLEQKG